MADLTALNRLNRLLAVHLFGWREAEQDDYPQVEHPCLIDPDGNISWEPTNYAGTWAGMGEVVEAMQRQGYRWNIENVQRWGETEQTHHAWFYMHRHDFGEGPREGAARGPSVMECVARATLAALGVKVEEGDGG